MMPRDWSLPSPIVGEGDTEDRMSGFRRSPLYLPLRLAFTRLILVVHQRDALFGEGVADGIGLGEILAVEGGEAVGYGVGDVRRLFPAVVRGQKAIEAEAEKAQGGG